MTFQPLVRSIIVWTTTESFVQQLSNWRAHTFRQVATNIKRSGMGRSFTILFVNTFGFFPETRRTSKSIPLASAYASASRSSLGSQSDCLPTRDESVVHRSRGTGCHLSVPASADVFDKVVDFQLEYEVEVGSPPRHLRDYIITF